MAKQPRFTDPTIERGGQGDFVWLNRPLASVPDTLLDVVNPRTSYPIDQLARTGMKITAVETFRPTFQPNVLLLRLHGDDGNAGLGDTFFGAAAVEEYLHGTAAPVLFELDDPSPERVSAALAPYVGYQGGGVETRANGAIDIALWDLLGRRSALSVSELLGGPVRDYIKVYNTCAGPGYVSTSTRQESANWGLGRGTDSGYEDLEAFLHRPDELAVDLWESGIRGMKVWPFDTGAERTGGTHIEPEDLEAGIAVVAAIREAVGDKLDLMVELHGLWSLTGARTICRALEPYRPFWVEDPLRLDAADAYGRLRESVSVPIAAGETCVGRRGFFPLLAGGALDVAIVDLHWTGGITEGRKIASLADSFGVPVAPHDCAGPVSFAASVHFVLSQPNGLIQETVRAFAATWYNELVTGFPVVTDGHIGIGREPGLGIQLRDDLAERDDIDHRLTRG